MRPNTGYAMLHRLSICPAKHKHRATQSSPNTQGTWTHRSEQKRGKKFRGESKGRTIKNIQGDQMESFISGGRSGGARMESKPGLCRASSARSGETPGEERERAQAWGGLHTANFGVTAAAR